MYPQAGGQPPLRQAIADYYNRFYGSKISPENVAVFAGGRPAIFAILAFLLEDVTVAIEETEYTPYYDVLKALNRAHTLIPSNRGNCFRPTLADHPEADRLLLVKSNPCNRPASPWLATNYRSSSNSTASPVAVLSSVRRTSSSTRSSR